MIALGSFGRYLNFNGALVNDDERCSNVEVMVVMLMMVLRAVGRQAQARRLAAPGMGCWAWPLRGFSAPCADVGPKNSGRLRHSADDNEHPAPSQLTSPI